MLLLTDDIEDVWCSCPTVGQLSTTEKSEGLRNVFIGLVKGIWSCAPLLGIVDRMSAATDQAKTTCRLPRTKTRPLPPPALRERLAPRFLLCVMLSAFSRSRVGTIVNSQLQ